MASDLLGVAVHPAADPRALRDIAEQLVAEWCDGSVAPPGSAGWHLLSPLHGRVQVRARSRATSKHLNWFHVSHLEENAFDYLVVVLFDRAGDVEGAWGMTAEELPRHAHSTITRADGRRVTKLAIRGDWTQRVERIPL